jgi:hypothetical protein
MSDEIHLSDQPGSQGRVSLASDGANFMAAWIDSSWQIPEDGVYARRINSRGIPQGDAGGFQIFELSTLDNEIDGLDLTFSPGFGYLAAWSFRHDSGAHWDIMGAHLLPDQDTSEGSATVLDDREYSQSQPAVACGSNGKCLLAESDSPFTSPNDLSGFFIQSSPFFTSGSPPSPIMSGTPYNFTFTASGYPAPQYSIPSGSLPPGLSLDKNSGLLSGTPTTEGNYTFTIQADNGVAPTATQNITIQVIEGQSPRLLFLPLLQR